MVIGKILVSAMILKHHSELFSVVFGVQQLRKLSVPKVECFGQKSVTPDHVLLDFFRSSSEVFVANTVKDTLKLPKYPFTHHNNQERLTHWFNLCKNYAIAGPEEDHLDNVNERRISDAMNQRHFLPILDALLSLGFNTKGANFLLK